MNHLAEMILPLSLVFIVTVGLSVLIFFLIEKNKAKKGQSILKNAEEKASKILEEAKKTAESEKKEKIIPDDVKM